MLDRRICPPLKRGKEYTVTRTYKKNLKSVAEFWIGVSAFCADRSSCPLCRSCQRLFQSTSLPSRLLLTSGRTALTITRKTWLFAINRSSSVRHPESVGIAAEHRQYIAGRPSGDGVNGSVQSSRCAQSLAFLTGKAGLFSRGLSATSEALGGAGVSDGTQELELTHFDCRAG